MGSLELGPEPARHSPVIRAARALTFDVARRLAAAQPYKVVLPLIGAQWALAAIIAYRVGHTGPATLVIPQVAVLGPLGLIVVYELAMRLAGRVFAAWAGFVWVVLPFAGLLYATPSLRHPYAHGFLLEVLGLSDDPRFSATVAFGAAAYFTIRALEDEALINVAAAVAAAATGSALAPREALIAVAPVVALAVAGRRRHALVTAAGLVALLSGVAVAVSDARLTGPFGHLGFGDPWLAVAGLRENLWSGRVLVWLVIAGVVAVLLRSPRVALVVALSFLMAFVSVGSGRAPLDRTIALLHDLIPAWFAVVLLVASIPLLRPRGRDAGARPTGVVVRDYWERIQRPVFAPRVAAGEAEHAVATPLWAAVSLGALFVLMLVVGMWNATRAHVYGGYDAQEHIDYAYNLIHHGQIPSQSGGGEFYTPPGFYAIAGVALWVGQLIGTFEPPHMALYLNAIYVLCTAGLLLVLARLVFPRRPAVWVSAVGFFAFLPAVAKTAGMFYPETLNMLVSTAAITLATWMLLRRRLSLKWLLALGGVLAAGQLVRASSTFTLVAVGIGFMAAACARRYRRHMPLRTVAIAIGVLVALASPWYLRQFLKYHTVPHANIAIYWNGLSGEILARDPYFRVSTDDLLNRPVRPYFINEAFPVMYTEVWGDWFGYWAWSGYSAGPSPEALAVLKQQTRIGILPTALAIAGWLALIGVAVRRRVEGISLLPVVLLPLFAVGIVFWRAYAQPTPDGNLIKASYALTSAPIWALAFGVAVEWLSRRRLIGLGLAVALVTLGILTLRFNMYGVRDHFTIF
ncbi:MAG TPA: hypothetical protein VIG35_05380 [Gaiellaceae bacterium]